MCGLGSTGEPCPALPRKPKRAPSRAPARPQAQLLAYPNTQPRQIEPSVSRARSNLCFASRRMCDACPTLEAMHSTYLDGRPTLEAMRDAAYVGSGLMWPRRLVPRYIRWSRRAIVPEDGISCEVIDLATIMPGDMHTVR